MANNTEKRTVEIVMNGSQPAKTLNELSKDINILRANLRKLAQDDPAFEAQSKQLVELRNKYNDLNQSIYKTERQFKNFKELVMSVSLGTVIGNITTAVGASINSYLSGTIDYLAETSDQLADIRKTTGATTDEIDRLEESLGKIETRTSRTDLRNIAIIGGQLDVPIQQMEGFIESIDKISVALGDEFSGGVEDITNQLGVLRNLLTDMKSADYGSDILKIGNALNIAGASGIATAPVVTDIATRIASIGRQSGLSSSQILGIAISIQELGIGVERGSTAVTRLLQKMKTDIPAFAKVAGLPIKEFSNLVNNNMFEAFKKVIEGSKQAGKENTAFAKVLKDLELEGAGVSELFSALGQNMGLLSDKVSLMGEATQSTASITDEFSIKNENLAAKIDKLKKEFEALKSSDAIQSFLKSGITGVGNFISILKSLGSFLFRNKEIILSVAAAYATYRIAAALSATQTKINIALEKARAIATNLAVAGIRALIVAEELLTGKIKLATVAERIRQAVFAASPWRMLATLVVGAAVAFGLLKAKIKEANQEAVRDMFSKMIENMTEKMAKLKGEIDDFMNDINKKSISELNIGINKYTIEISNAEKATAKLKAEILGLQKDVKTGSRWLDIKGQDKAILINMSDDEKNFSQERLKLLQAELKENQELLETKKKAIIAAQDEINNRQKVYTEEAKQKEAEKNNEILNLQVQFNQKLKELLNDGARARAEVIEDELQRELALYKVDFEQKLDLAQKEYKELVQLAKKLGKSTSDIDKNFADIKLGIEKNYQQKRKEFIEKFQKEIAEEEFQLEIDNLEAYIQRKELIITQQYEQGIITKNEYDQQITQLEINKNEILLQIQNDYSKNTVSTEIAISKAKIKITEDETEKRKQALLAAFEFEKDLADRNAQQAERRGFGKKQAYKKQLEAETNLLLAKLAADLGYTELNEQAKLEIKAKYAELFDKINKEYAEKEQDRRKGIAEQAFNEFAELFNSLSEIRSNKLDADLQKIQSAYSKEIELLEETKNKRLISDTDYNAKKKLLDDRYRVQENAIKRKQAIAERRRAMFEIGIQTAVNITKAFPNIAMMALAAVTGAIQLGVAASRPIPSYGTGNKFTDKELKGPSHTSKYKGMPITNPITGQIVGFVEGGEILLSKNTYQNNREIIDMLLDSSLNRNGQTVSFPAPTYSNPTLSVDYGTMTDRVRTVSMARGGILGGTSTTNNYSTNTNVNNDNGLTDAITRLNNNLEGGILAVLNYDYFKERIALIDKQQENGNVNP